QRGHDYEILPRHTWSSLALAGLVLARGPRPTLAVSIALRLRLSVERSGIPAVIRPPGSGGGLPPWGYLDDRMQWNGTARSVRLRRVTDVNVSSASCPAQTARTP